MDNLFYRKDRKRFDIKPFLKRLLKNKRLMVALLVAVPLLGFVVFGNRGILQRIRMQNEKAELDAKIRAAEAERKALESESKALDGDKKMIEKVAREKHGMVREGERVYRVKPAK